MDLLIPTMTPEPGALVQRFAGDWIHFAVQDRRGRPPAAGWKAFLRTNLGRAAVLRREILEAHTRGLPIAGASWRDLPMIPDERGWTLRLPLAEPGGFRAKAYVTDPRGWQHWPEGPNVAISVHPRDYRAGNIIYSAFPRMFGATRFLEAANGVPAPVAALDREGYTVIPPSGKLRDLLRELPHIFDTLGCRILQLLPVNPVPATYARFGRYGSPYAALDLTGIDPALVEFDKKTTGIDQFRELAYGVHLHGGKLFLDLAINHTGWGSTLQERRPDWFARREDGTFVSPGAWGTVWEDLVELRHDNVALWDELAEVFLTWCRRGVDGFRCDAGYMVPVRAWQYIIARVRQEYSEILFLLEGLGGAWEATEALLLEAGMQWAYSELFQNYSGPQVGGYLEHALRQPGRTGVLVHFSETHDNDRLAARGRAWSLLRNRLCALASMNGAYGYACGVEWLATEKIQVHGSSGMAWGGAENLMPELAALSRLLRDHPCFFDHAELDRLSAADAPVLALQRRSAEGQDTVLVLVNLSVDQPAALRLPAAGAARLSGIHDWRDLLGQTPPQWEQTADAYTVTLAAGAAFCLAPQAAPAGLSGAAYHRARQQAAWALEAMCRVLPTAGVPELPWRELAALIERSPGTFLSAIAQPGGADSRERAAAAIRRAFAGDPIFPRVIEWTAADSRRVTLAPPGHWLLIRENCPFRASLEAADSPSENVEAIPSGSSFVAAFAPRLAADARLRVERYGAEPRTLEAQIQFLPASPEQASRPPSATNLALLTNGRGGMARMAVDLGRVLSKYDCALAANLHPELPVDRHVFVKRIRVWVNADGFISPLDFRGLQSFDAGPPAVWRFSANAGDGRTVGIQVTAEMPAGQNTTLFRFQRSNSIGAGGKSPPERAEVSLSARLDLEDRNFHTQTRRNPGAEHHFAIHTRPCSARLAPEEVWTGFEFTPAPDRQLRALASAGVVYFPQPEWSVGIPHPVEQTRGQEPGGDAYSPGWFKIPLPQGGGATLLLTAEAQLPERASLAARPAPGDPPAAEAADPFSRQLAKAMGAFLVRRGTGRTVIAGYPWFLDWGRDTFISARGYLALGQVAEVRQMLLTFGRFEDRGTLPNTIFGEDASNRDTADAPLWYALVCEEAARLEGPALYNLRVERSGRTLLEVLQSIAAHYQRGTPNQIRMDPESGLIWSPAHFTWMDTNHPAATPRQGYPVELQVLWIRLLRQLAGLCPGGEAAAFESLAARAGQFLETHFWLEEKGYYADVILAAPGQPAQAGVVDDALRSNFLFLISLGLATGSRARRGVEAARRHLVVPGALRSLAPLPVSVPLPVYGPGGQLLNDPVHPYWGRYEGDEDTRRKPAYHNGAAWTWTFPVFCEALARAWEPDPAAAEAAAAYLGSMARLMTAGCLGQIPEILDGDAPHQPRGCDAQAWAATEAFRVWRWLTRDRA